MSPKNDLSMSEFIDFISMLPIEADRERATS